MSIPKLVADVESIAEWLRDRVTCSICYIGYFSEWGDRDRVVSVWAGLGARLGAAKEEAVMGAVLSGSWLGKGWMII